MTLCTRAQRCLVAHRDCGGGVAAVSVSCGSLWDCLVVLPTGSGGNSGAAKYGVSGLHRPDVPREYFSMKSKSKGLKARAVIRPRKPDGGALFSVCSSHEPLRFESLNCVYSKPLHIRDCQLRKMMDIPFRHCQSSCHEMYYFLHLGS